MSKKRKIPLIKENRLGKLTEVLRNFNKFPYDREKQKEFILKLYPHKSEKSVFRGMVIPSLRYLGLILGYENFIRLSANGSIILEGEKKSGKEKLRIWRAIILELDSNKFGFLKKLKDKKSTNKKVLVENLLQTIEGSSQKQITERINKWLRILTDSKLVISEEKDLILDKKKIGLTEDDLSVKNKKNMFKKNLFEEYKTFPYKKTAGIVDIADLRESVGKKYYNEFGKVLTEVQFDDLLRNTPLITDEYTISLGHTMGAEEKLFNYKGEYYRTISMTFFERKGRENA